LDERQPIPSPASRRLRHPGIRPSGRTVAIDFDGRVLTALEGETIAAALAAHGVVALRRTRGGEQRGLYCGMGACQECLVSVDGLGSQRACMTKVRDGQVVRSAAPAGTADDPLQPLVPPAADAPEALQADVLVVGAGPAGLAAALAARRAGADVLVIDERAQTGGQFYKPLAPSHEAAHAPDRQFAAGLALQAEAAAAGVRVLQGAQAWAAFGARELGIVHEGRAKVVRCRQLVVAAGAYERPVPFPGWTLPGVMTTGAGQTLARAYRVAPGRRVLVAGNGPLNLQLAAELLQGGAEVVAVLESAPRPGPRLWRSVLAAVRHAPDLLADGARHLALLRRRGIPLVWGHAVTAAEGESALARVHAARLDADGRCVPGSERVFDADALCLGYGFIPSSELPRLLGCRQQPVARHLGYLAVETDDEGRSSVDGVFVVGDGADLGGARVALARGTLAGTAAARALGLAVPDPHAARAALMHALAFQHALWTIYQAPPPRLADVADDTVLCRCETLRFGDVRAQIAQGRDTLAALKRNLRLGMGRCQGRYCSATAARLVHECTGRPPSVDASFAPRPPVRPLPAAALAFEKPEWGGHRQAITPNLARPVPCEAFGTQQADVLVIGGGVLGCSVAHALARDGVDVLVAERDDVNLQASGANAGSLHVQLLSFDFGAKAQAGGGPAAATLPLGPLAVQLWRQLQDESGQDLEVKITGGLMVADSEPGLRFLAAKAALERSHGIEAHVIGAPELRRLAPALSESLIGAEWCPMEGKINPLRATYAVAGLAARHGARFLRGCDVQRIERAGPAFDVHTSRGRIRAGRIVNAAGAWSRVVGAMLGIDVPVNGAPLQMIVTEPAPPLVEHLVAHADRHLSMKQAASGGLIIGGGWSAAFVEAQRMNAAERASIEGNLWVAQRVLPQLAGLHVLRCWAGMNVNIDGAPILGEVPGVPGFFNAVTSNGYTLAPIAARIVADLLLRGRAEVDVRPYRIERFQT
jgi:glycine/D-amino acid oxidase-like deaminating enzyme